MNLNIHIVDDQPLSVQQLKRAFRAYAQTRGQLSVTIGVHSSPEKLIARWDDSIDCIFMKIEFKGMTGIEAAHRIRDLGYQGQLIFISALPDFVFDGYGVDALDYMLKPLSKERLFRNLDLVISRCANAHYVFRYRNQLKKIPFQNIIYFSTSGHKLNIKTTEGVFEQTVKLSDLEADLPPQFCRCHRTTIVNLNHVTTMEGSLLPLSNGETLSVSRTFVKQIRQALAQ